MSVWKWVVAGILIAGSAVGVGVYAYRDSGGRDEKAFEYDIDRFRVTDPDLIRYREVQTVALGTRDLRGLALDPEGRGQGGTARIHVAADSMVVILDQNGRRVGGYDLPEPANCLAVGNDGVTFVGMRTHVEVYDRDGAKQGSWMDLGEKAYLASVAVHGSDVFVADAGQRIVWRFDASGRLLRQIGQKDRAKGYLGFIIPSPYFDVAVAADGALWVVNPGQQRVENFTYDGERKGFWGKSSMKVDGFCGCCNPSHIAIAADGSFVTSEKGIPRVKVYGADGAFREVVAGPEQFAVGTEDLDLAVDAAGRVLVLDPRAGSLRVFEPMVPVDGGSERARSDDG